MKDNTVNHQKPPTFDSKHVPESIGYFNVCKVDRDIVGVIRPLLISGGFEFFVNDDHDEDTQIFTKIYLVELVTQMSFPKENVTVYRSNHLASRTARSDERIAFNNTIKKLFPMGVSVSDVDVISNVCGLSKMDVFARLKRIKIIKQPEKLYA